MTDFGRDISCTDSILSGRLVTGLRLVAEAMVRRISTRRGLLVGGEPEANYGIDIRDIIGSVTADRDLPSLPARIKAELTKDERVERVDVDVRPIRTGADISVEIDIDALTHEGPFELVLAASAVSVDILSFRET